MADGASAALTSAGATPHVPLVRVSRPYHLLPVGRVLALRMRAEHTTIGTLGVPRLGPEAGPPGLDPPRALGRLIAHHAPERLLPARAAP